MLFGTSNILLNYIFWNRIGQFWEVSIKKEHLTVYFLLFISKYQDFQVNQVKVKIVQLSKKKNRERERRADSSKQRRDTTDFLYMYMYRLRLQLPRRLDFNAYFTDGSSWVAEFLLTPGLLLYFRQDS